MNKKLLIKQIQEDTKKLIIKDHLKDCAEPTKIGKSTFKPTKKDLDDYQVTLEKLSIKELNSLKKTYKRTKKQTLYMGLKKLNKKKSVLITLHRNNNARTHHIIHSKTRFFTIEKKKYLVPPTINHYDPLYKLPLIEYFENNPIPIEYTNDKEPATPDSELLQEAMHFEYATKLARVSELQKKLDMTMIFSVLAFVTSLACCVLTGLVANHLNLF